MPSNESLGRLLGVSHATISRYRSGDRLPMVDVMGKIADQFKWSMDDQYAARQDGKYASEFESRVVAAADRGALGKDATQNQQSGKGKTATHAPSRR